MIEKNKIPFLYRLLKHWVKFFHDYFYYRKVYNINLKNIPPHGTPLIVVSNHQNSLNDAMGIVLSLDVRRPRFLARADIFKKPLIAKFMYFFGLLPIYRQRDGVENIKNNLNIFDTVEDHIEKGYTIVIFPEAGHQDYHYLGRFYLAYTRLAFEAAKRSNFEKDIFILPCANHYNDYFKWREEFVMTYGTPISIKPFYSLYKEQPRLAQEQVNEIVKSQVESMMLHIPDLENYDAIYFILQSYGRMFAIKNGLNPNKLPEKLRADQKLTKILLNFHEQDIEKSNELYALANSYKNELKELKINDEIIDKPIGMVSLTAQLILFILLLPIFLYGYLHHVIQYNIPRIIGRNLEDKLMYPSINFGISVLGTLPIFYILFFVISLWFLHPLLSIIYVLTLPLFGIFAWNYRKMFLTFRKKWRFYKMLYTKKQTIEFLVKLREELYEKMNKIVNQ